MSRYSVAFSALQELVAADRVLLAKTDFEGYPKLVVRQTSTKTAAPGTTGRRTTTGMAMQDYQGTA